MLIRRSKLPVLGCLAALALSACHHQSARGPALPSAGFQTSVSDHEFGTGVVDSRDNSGASKLRTKTKLVSGPALVGPGQRATQADPSKPPAKTPPTQPTPNPIESHPRQLSQQGKSPAWWQQEVARPLGRPKLARAVSLQQLVVLALSQSPQVQAISQQGLIQETAITEALSEFDARSFAESKFRQSSDPVGNTLVTGGPLRLRETDYYYSAGVRKKVDLGGTIELAQRMGIRENNSRFFDPRVQGNAQLTLSFTQPILNGAGKAYNNSLVVLAQIDTEIAWKKANGDLQQFLMQVGEAYWELYLHRATLLQKQRSLDRAQAIAKQLEARRGLDASRRQILRARAAASERQAQLVRAETMVKNVEAKIRSMVALDSFEELVPADTPATMPIKISFPDAMVTAMSHRPEVERAMKQVKAASVRLAMSENELLPVFDLVLETYVAGLAGQGRTGRALIKQFDEGQPSYSAGFVMEVPLGGNRGAKARQRRRRLTVSQLSSQMDATMKTLQAEVEIAVREVNTAYRELVARERSLGFAKADVESITNRWKTMIDDRSASLVLEDLLDAQDRLAVQERGYANSQRAYSVSLINLQHAMGTLLRYHNVPFHSAAASSQREQPLTHDGGLK